MRVEVSKHGSLAFIRVIYSLFFRPLLIVYRVPRFYFDQAAHMLVF